MTDKLDLQSPDLVNENIQKIAALFPNCVTETDEGKAIDFDLLRQELNHEIVEGAKERYRLEWPGKREAIVTANLPTTKTLRPVPEESVNFDTTENLYIEGDNLEVLKLLQESYLGKIKMIYIDPPYNTGNDFVYNDKFAQDTTEFKEDSGLLGDQGQRLVANPKTAGRYHSDWLTMMYSRLKLARNLLTDDGVIFISIDDNEIHNLRMLMNEIFGESNFQEEIIWKNKYNSGALTKGFSNIHEYILCFSKDSIDNIEAPLDDETIKKYDKKDEKYSVRGGFVTQPLATGSKDARPNLCYPIFYNGVEILPAKQWIWSKERVEKAIENNEVVFNEAGDTYNPRVKQYLRDEFGIIRKGKPISILIGPYNQEGSKEIKNLFAENVFGFPKPIRLLKYLISITTNDNENNDGIILDFFSGSGTLAQAVLDLNNEDNGTRKFICIQLPEACDESSEPFKAGYKNICEIGKERIRRAGKKIADELKAKIEKQKEERVGKLEFDDEDQSINQENQSLDIGFRVYRLDSSNMQDVYYRPQDYKQANLDLFADNIKPDRTPRDLLTQVMLDWGLPLSYRIEEILIDGKQVFRVAQNSLIACFDNGINEAFAKELATHAPLRVVFRDLSFADDTAKENVKQLLKQLSPETEMRVI